MMMSGIPQALRLRPRLLGQLGERFLTCLAIALLSSASFGATPLNRSLTVGGGTIEVSISGGGRLSDAALFRWIDTAARAVTAYFGRYPVPRVRLYVNTSGSGGIENGVTYGGHAPSIRIEVGRGTNQSDLQDDWKLTHEMVHLAFPDLTSDDSWAEEGLATYVEPMARVRVANLSEERVWSDLMDGLPNGLPGRGDSGLHATKEWGRTYWGGALFWLLADIEIHERTGNRRGLVDALAGIFDAGGSIGTTWPLLKTLSAGDHALGLTVLSDLYRKFGAAPGTVDLQELWRRLGVRRAQGRIAYDESAPLADVRRAITKGPRGSRVGQAARRGVRRGQPGQRHPRRPSAKTPQTTPIGFMA